MRVLIRGVSGVRGLTAGEITPDLARRYGRAFSVRAPGKIAVGWDSRTGGDALKDAVAAGIAEAGGGVLDLGVVPTPTVGVVVRLRALAGGVVVTASHNPEEYNGLKFFSSRGVFLDGEEVAGLFAAVDAQADAGPRPTRGPSLVPVDDAVAEHVDLVLASRVVDVDAVVAAAPRVVLDCVNAAGSVFLSHTKLHGRYVLRLTIGNLRTMREHVERAWGLIRQARQRLPTQVVRNDR